MTCGPGDECFSEECNPSTGQCEPNFEPASTPCTDSDGNDCTLAGCDGQGACNQDHIFAPPSSPCDVDGSLCTIAGCDGQGTCNQDHETVTCEDGLCFDEECDTATGECVRTCAPDGIDGCEITVGDFIWNDANEDGSQDDGATGIEDVVVNLIDCSGGQDQIIDSFTTVDDGFYTFTVAAVDDNCLPTTRDLVVEVDDANFSDGAVLNGFDGSPKDNAGDAFDSDCDPFSHRTDCFTFTADDPTRDCGFFVPCEIEVEKTCVVLTPPACDAGSPFHGSGQPHRFARSG